MEEKVKLQPTKIVEALPTVKRGFVLLEDTSGKQFVVSEATYLKSFTDTTKFTKKKSNTGK